MNEMEVVNQSQIETEESLRNKCIHVYKTILKYYKGRSLSLDVILANKQANINISQHMKTYEELKKNLKGLHDDISLIQCLKECVKVMTNSLTCTEITTLNNFNFRGDLLHKLEGVIYFSKSIMKLYNERYSDLDLIERKLLYTKALSDYGKNLEEVQKKEQEKQSDENKVMEKAELQIYKINLIRAMKAVLIGFITVNYPSILPQVQQFRTSFRRNLTMDDFSDSWDVGLASQT